MAPSPLRFVFLAASPFLHRMKNPLPRLFVALALVAFTASVFASAAPSPVAVLESVTYRPSEVITLWPGLPPGEKAGAYGPEYVLPERPRPFDQITDVTVPTLSVFLPKPEKATGTAMLVIPGGGLERLAIEHEGYEIAEWLNHQGIAVFMLKYRVPARDPQQRWKVGLQDAQRAMGIIRSRAQEWHVDQDSIGTIGFSAGGEINVMLATYHAEPRQYDPIDAADKLSTRPDFNIVIYGGGFANARDNTMREDIAKRINRDTPPMFIAHAFDDSALSSIILMNALKRANVASELHVFGAGGHGFGIRGTGLPVGHWGELCLNWMTWLGYLDNASVRKYARDFAGYRTGGPGTRPQFTAAVPKPDLAQAFAAQRRIVNLAVKNGDEVVGYTAGLTTAATQKAVKLTTPLHGALLKSGRIEAKPGTPVVVTTHQATLVQPQIGYVIAVDIGTKLVVPRQALTTVQAVVPVVELPREYATIKAGRPLGNPLDAVAENLRAGKFIVGAPLAPKLVGNTDALTVTLTRDAEKLWTATGAEAKGGQAIMLMTLINQIIEQGRVLHAGDIVLSGPLSDKQTSQKGSYTADFGKLGTIAFTLE